MPNEKLFTAKEAAKAVLAKASEMLTVFSLAKSQDWAQHPKASSIHLKTHSNGTKMQIQQGFPGLSGGSRISVGSQHVDHRGSLDAAKAHADKMAGESNLGKSEGAPAEKQVAAPEGVKADPNPAAPNDKVNGNPAPGALPQNQEKYAAEGLKGHLKLAKFVGRMEEKRKSISAPMDKGEGVDRNAGAPLHRKVAYDKAGDKVSSQIAAEGAKENHVKKLAEMKAAPKPDLGKAETGHEKGINVSVNPKSGKSSSNAGKDVKSAKRDSDFAATGKASSPKILNSMASDAVGRAKESHKQVLGQMKQMPKPKLPG